VRAAHWQPCQALRDQITIQQPKSHMPRYQHPPNSPPHRLLPESPSASCMLGYLPEGPVPCSVGSGFLLPREEEQVIIRRLISRRRSWWPPRSPLGGSDSSRSFGTLTSREGGKPGLYTAKPATETGKGCTLAPKPSCQVHKTPSSQTQGTLQGGEAHNAGPGKPHARSPSQSSFHRANAQVPPEHSALRMSPTATESDAATQLMPQVG
jgi:hypothetical protein